MFCLSRALQPGLKAVTMRVCCVQLSKNILSLDLAYLLVSGRLPDLTQT